MSRGGAALLVALVVVLLGGMVAVLATMVAIAEVKSGESWRDRQAATALATSAFARSRERAESLFDSLVAGESSALDDTLSLTRLGDSMALITSRAQYRSSQEVTVTLLRAGRDSAGLPQLAVPQSRNRYRPIP